jgi:hypothetical protein
MLTRTRTSDITLHRRCRRQWFYAIRVGVPQKPKTHLDRGTLGHADVERWLTTGQEPRTASGRVLINNLVDRGFEAGCASDGCQVLAEWSWQLVVYPDGPDFGSVTYTGQADLVVLIPGQDPILIDHKTMALLQGALTAEQLHDNVQLRVYAHAVFTLLAPTAQQMGVIHNCAETRGKNPIGKLTGTTITRLEAAETFGEVLQTVALMRQDALCASAEDVMGDITGAACSMYSGCPFRTRCSTWATIQHAPATPGDGGSLMSMLDSFMPPPAATSPAPPASEPLHVREERTGPAEAIAPRGFALFIDCYPVPVGGEVLDDLVPLEQYLAPLVAHVCEQAGVPHYSFIDGWVGKGRVSALLEANLPAGRVLVDSRLPLSPLAIEVLVPHAYAITRGAR